MDLQLLSQLIMSLGFPIFAACACGWFIVYTTKQHAEEINRLHEMHNSEIKEITEAINNNTLVIQRLIDKLDKEDISL